MPLYETVVILRHDLPPDQVNAITQKYVEMMQKDGGKVVKVEPWGLRLLAYPIRKNRNGHYVLLQITAPSAAVQSLENALRLDEDILRSLTVKVEAHDPEPSAILRRDERDASPAPRGTVGRTGFSSPAGFRSGNSLTSSGRAVRAPFDNSSSRAV